MGIGACDLEIGACDLALDVTPVSTFDGVNVGVLDDAAVDRDLAVGAREFAGSSNTSTRSCRELLAVRSVAARDSYSTEDGLWEAEYGL